MSENLCFSCRRPKATLECEICQEALCKSCVIFLDASTFSYLRKVPEQLTHTYYCAGCHDSHVQPALESYNEVMERAKELHFFFKTQRKPIPLIKREKFTLQVNDCEDRDETILRLAFLAAEQGYNALIEADVVAEKVRNGGHQKSSWKGSAVPAHVNAERLNYDDD